MNADSLSGIALLGLTGDAGALYIMSNLLAEYWPHIAALALLTLPRIYAHNPRPEKEPETISNTDPAR